MALVHASTVSLFSGTTYGMAQKIHEEQAVAVLHSATNPICHLSVATGSLVKSYFSGLDDRIIVFFSPQTLPFSNRTVYIANDFTNHYYVGILEWDTAVAGDFDDFPGDYVDDVPSLTATSLVAFAMTSPTTGYVIVLGEVDANVTKYYLTTFSISGNVITVNAPTLKHTRDITGNASPVTFPDTAVGLGNGQALQKWVKMTWNGSSYDSTDAYDLVNQGDIGSYDEEVAITEFDFESTALIDLDMALFSNSTDIHIINTQSGFLGTPNDLDNWLGSGNTAVKVIMGSLGYRKGLIVWSYTGGIGVGTHFITEMTPDETTGLLNVDGGIDISIASHRDNFQVIPMKDGTEALVMCWSSSGGNLTYAKHITGVSGWVDAPAVAADSFYYGVNSLVQRSTLPFAIAGPSALAVRGDKTAALGGLAAGAAGEIVVRGSLADNYAAWVDITDSLAGVPVNALNWVNGEEVI